MAGPGIIGIGIQNDSGIAHLKQRPYQQTQGNSSDLFLLIAGFADFDANIGRAAVNPALAHFPNGNTVMKEH